MRTRTWVVAGLAAVALASCGIQSPGVTASRSAQPPAGLFPADTTAPSNGVHNVVATTTTEPSYPVIGGVVDFGEAGPQHPDYDGFLTTAFRDIESFWAEQFPATYGSPFEPLKGGIYAAYPARTSPIPGCGTPKSTYEDVQRGTAFYCVDGDFMAYDDADGLPKLVQQLGKQAVAVVLAHEFGHAIQSRANEWNQLGVLKEQQADCFAGAWTAHVASGGSSTIHFNDTDVRAGLVAMINVADPIAGAGLADALAHGTGFDRVGAFQDGFQGGTARCKTFFTEDRVNKLIDIQFDSNDVNGGNLPLVDPNPDAKLGPQDIVTLIPASLDEFWTDQATKSSVPFTKPTLTPFPDAGPYPTCDGIRASEWAHNARYCAADNTIYWDQDEMLKLSLDRITGDMSVGYLLAGGFSDAFLDGLRSTVAGEKRALANDCLTGAWVGSIVPPIPTDRVDKLVLSAGDLDEAIVTAISRSDPTIDTNLHGSAFERIAAFRTGVLGGLAVCRSQIG